MKDVVDIHSHTIASGHAYNSIYEMIKSASEKNIEVYGISDHGPAMECTIGRFYFYGADKVPRNLYGIRVLFGCELNIIDYNGKVDLTGKYASRIDYGIASLHDMCITPGTLRENTNAYIKAMANPLVKVIGHPDDGIFPVDMDELAKSASDNNVLLELNECSVKPDTHRLNGRENAVKMLESCVKYNTKIVISSDAHIEYMIGQHTYAHKLLEELKFPQELVVNRDGRILLDMFKKRS